jgi:hypothetical protein
MTSISGNFPLFLQGVEPYTSNNNTNLFTYGCSTGRSGIGLGFDLFIQGTSVVNSNLNLFLQNYGPEALSGSMNLFIDGAAYTINNYIPLRVENSGVEKSLTLFIKGSGIKAGATPFNSSMNLFIERNEAAEISLFLQGEGEYINNNTPLYVFGAYLANSGVDLVISDIVGVGTGALRLYTHGF